MGACTRWVRLPLLWSLYDKLIPFFDPVVGGQSMKLKNGMPPLSKAVISQLRIDASNVRAAAVRKNLVLDKYEEREETLAAKRYFQLGAWLYYYKHEMWRDRGRNYLDMQVACLLRLFQAQIPSPGYRFFTVFDFGDRDFDTLFENGNSAEVLQELRAIYFQTKDAAIASGFAYHGWQLSDERQLALFE
jgi:hypothetical protein